VSSSTWTPHAVASKAAKASVRLWRAVEAQHVASTRRLVDDLEEQRVLEDILEATKPAVPPAAVNLDYLLFTPFRYPALRPSRFRDIQDPGVFYGAEAVRTACAELGFWRWRFLVESKALTTLGPAQQTLFEVGVKTSAVDLERKPYVRDAGIWRHPDDYSGTQHFARAARAAGIGLVRYASVRDPASGRCGAVLHPGAFSSPRPVSPTQTWLLTVTATHAVWQRDREAFEFDMRVWKKALA
jgi:RES domain-containing protein